MRLRREWLCVFVYGLTSLDPCFSCDDNAVLRKNIFQKGTVTEMILETERLILREMTDDDFDGLYEILSDAETMKFYPKPFDKEKVRGWINWNKDNYKTFGFGLWAVVLKQSGRLIGDCGVTMQWINHSIRPEIGYHIHKDYRLRGYASEAAARCRDYVFEETPFNAVYSYMKSTNVGSYSTAIKNGMKLVEEYDDPVNTVSRAYAITREEWERIKVLGNC